MTSQLSPKGTSGVSGQHVAWAIAACVCVVGSAIAVLLATGFFDPTEATAPFTVRDSASPADDRADMPSPERGRVRPESPRMGGDLEDQEVSTVGRRLVLSTSLAIWCRDTLDNRTIEDIRLSILCR